MNKSNQKIAESTVKLENAPFSHNYFHKKRK